MAATTTQPPQALSEQDALAKRLTEGSHLTTLLALSMVAAAMVINEKRNAKNNIVLELRSTADVVALNIGAALLFDDVESAAEDLRALAARNGIAAAVVYGRDGEVFSRFSAEDRYAMAVTS